MTINTSKKKAIIFSPYSLAWELTFPEALVGEAFLQGGHDLTYVSCDRILHGECIPLHNSAKDHNSSPEEIEKVCKRCQSNKNILVEEFGFKEEKISKWITPAEHLEIEDRLKSVDRKNFLGFEFHGLQIARLAIYELLLDFKKITLEFSDNEWDRYIKNIRNAMRVAIASEKILKAKSPDLVLVYNSLYSANSVFCRMAERLEIRVHFMHGGTNLANQLGSIMLGKVFTWQHLKNVAGKWNDFRIVPASLSNLELAQAHVMSLLKANNLFVYSEAATSNISDLRSKIGIKPSQKLVIACMSSYDERFSVETVGAFDSTYNLIFPKQVDWIKALVQWFEGKEELFLLVRVHPREFPNKRDSLLSEHAILLKQIFSNLPSNVKINWPTDKISIYDLVKEADLFLNAWSSVGKEMGIFGVPTVVYSPDLLLYPADLNIVGNKDCKQYFEKIEEALSTGWSFDRIVQTYRWFALEFGVSQIDISESYKGPQRLQKRSLYTKIKERLILKYFRNNKLRNICRKRAPQLRNQKLISDLLSQGLELPDERLQDYRKHHSTTALEKEFLLKKIKEISIVFAGETPDQFYQSNLGKNFKNLLANENANQK